jgi:hypothetical protein
MVGEKESPESHEPEVFQLRHSLKGYEMPSLLAKRPRAQEHCRMRFPVAAERTETNPPSRTIEDAV